MSPLVKICGLTDPVAIKAAADARADFAGFTFFEKSPRFVTFEEAKALATHMPDTLERVALTVDPTDALIAEIDVALTPAYIQLHGDETPERVRDIAASFHLKTIKAISVETASDLEAARVYDGVADLLLFDAKPLKASRPGGWGSPFDWSLMAGTAWASPWLLAGGLTPENVAEALRITGAPGVDVSTGVEVEPGKKSPKLIEDFVTAAKGSG